jgi:glycosyltransferase domain-containing protein
MQKLSEISSAVRGAAVKVWAALGFGAEGRPSAAPVRRPLFELSKETDELLFLEVRTGCFGEVERSIAALSQAILQDSFDCAIGTESDVPDRVWISLLRLGLLEELRHLVLHHALPIRAEVKAFIDFCAHEYALCQQRGEALRASNPDRDIFTLGCIVWGREYVNNFLRYGVRSMLSEGNLPTLRSQGQVVFSIVTDVAGEVQIRQHSVFAQMCALGDVVFITMTESITGILRSGHLVRNFYVLYGMLDHCSIYFAQGARSHLFMIPVDAIVADGSLPNMANYRHEGFECCGGGNIVANTETFLPALDGLFGADGPISISTEELASLAVKHAHHYFTSQIIAKENQDFGKHPRELFWPVAGGVEIHSVFIHPLFTTASGLAKYQRRHFANIDYGMIPRLFSGSASIKIIDDPRKAYVNNYTAANRLYETTGMPFAQEDFIRSHGWSYPVQRSLFTRAQLLPCRLEGWTPYRDVATDVQEIILEFAEEEPPSALATTDLTIILPTFNRPALCRAQVQFLRRTKFQHRVIVADSSEQPDPELRRICRGLIEYRQFDPATVPSEKVVAVARSLTTPYVAMIADDDVSFPHAIDACLAFLRDNPDYVVAQGYVLSATMSREAFDIQNVMWFTQGISESTPLRRLYEHMRRYQPFFRAVLRTDAYFQGLDAANYAEGPFFKELAFTATVAALGKSKRLPMVYTLRGEEESLTQAKGHPFYWFLSNTNTFFEGYVQYRNRLAAFIKDLQKREEQLDGNTSAQNDKTPEELTHLLDIIHASYFGREIDTGMINHTARVLLGDAIKPLKFEESRWHGESIGPADLVHPAGREGRRYVWRKEVLNAEPRSEITISGEEIAHVEAVLDQYVPPEPGRAPLVSILETAEFPAVAENVPQVASVENASIDIDDVQVIRFAELKRYGLHRFTLRVADRRPKETAQWSVKVKADGCTRVKFELHDDGARKYGTCIIDLETGEKIDQSGALALAEVVSLPDGHLEINLALPWTAESQSHFSITLLDKGDSLVHPGDNKRAIKIAEIAFR